ncbi:MAG: hypothetical protein JXB18_07265 [Sedimentisphaerales bacterium]|nr:hypothetical protein [Sedimentisphaerales bacterium]
MAEPIKQNQLPMCQMCKRMLERVSEQVNPNHLYPTQLILWYLQNHELKGTWGSDQESLLLLAHSLIGMSPAKQIKMLLDVRGDEQGPEPEEGHSLEEAAEILIENLWYPMVERRC